MEAALEAALEDVEAVDVVVQSVAKVAVVCPRRWRAGAAVRG